MSTRPIFPKPFWHWQREHPVATLMYLLKRPRHSSVITQGTIEQLVTGLNDMKGAQNPFLDPETLTEREAGPAYTPSYSTAVTQMWLAQLTRDEFSAAYLAKRDQLSTAAYLGKWDEVLELVESGRVEHFESWINAARLSTDYAFLPTDEF
jgi:hypothetical protein